MFAKKYLQVVPTRVIFVDPAGNILNLATLRQGGSVYLTDGWKHLTQFYALTNGGWVDMIYNGAVNFKIRVYFPNGKEVCYPPIPESVIPDPRNQLVRAPPKQLPFNFIDYGKFRARLVKWVSYSELTGDIMVSVVSMHS